MSCNLAGGLKKQKPEAVQWRNNGDKKMMMMDGASVGLQCFFFLLALLLACLEEMELEKQGLGGTVR